MSSKLFYVKIHKQPEGQVVAACDEDIIGKTFSQGKMKITIAEHFYKGELIKINEVINILESCNNFNIAGSNIVNEAVSRKIISEESVLNIANISLAMKIIL